MQNNSVFLRTKRFIDRSVAAYFLAHPVVFSYIGRRQASRQL